MIHIQTTSSRKVNSPTPRKRKGISLTVGGSKNFQSRSYQDLSLQSMPGTLNRSDTEPRHIKLVVKAKS